MTNDFYDIHELLGYIDPAALEYTEWLEVGMALKDGGYTCDVWDDWSRRDGARYHSGECFSKWGSFQDSGITMGTVVKMAQDRGWHVFDGDAGEIGWDDVLTSDGPPRIIDPGWLEVAHEIAEPETWDPVQQITEYINLLFQPDDFVGYVTAVRETEDGLKPTRGSYDRTAKQLLADLARYKDFGNVFGDYTPEVGAWIRFNPLDGQGVKNDNVTAYRYALVESDNLPIDKQHAIIRQLELPAVVLVHSGKKSLHAIVRVDAADYKEYKQRVEFLYSVCEENGLKPDKQNKNPSRLSRMPGVIRNGHKQYIVATNIGKASWTEWVEWLEEINDDLPDMQTLQDIWDDPPPLAPELIPGVLRQGHKLLLAGPSKAGKSYLLMNLCIAIAEGRDWIGFGRCMQGKVLYVNLEIDGATCFRRFRDLYEALKYPPNHLQNIIVWNLRGGSLPMDKLTPKLVRRAKQLGCIAVILDPIYKVLTGDENSADQMATFCNQFDKVAHDLNASVIYCHHHSKGFQGGKRSMDRASGSGVFARDPDALLDMIELEKPADALGGDAKPWRIECTLREFATPEPVNVWFEWPVHRPDPELAAMQPEGSTPPYVKGANAKRAKAAQTSEIRQSVLYEAAMALTGGNIGSCMVDELVDKYTELRESTAPGGKVESKRTIMDEIKKCDFFSLRKAGDKQNSPYLCTFTPFEDDEDPPFD